LHLPARYAHHGPHTHQRGLFCELVQDDSGVKSLVKPYLKRSGREGRRGRRENDERGEGEEERRRKEDEMTVENMQ
jgi:hypothetical protein